MSNDPIAVALRSSAHAVVDKGCPISGAIIGAKSHGQPQHSSFESNRLHLPQRPRRRHARVHNDVNKCLSACPNVLAVNRRESSASADLDLCSGLMLQRIWPDSPQPFFVCDTWKRNAPVWRRGQGRNLLTATRWVGNGKLSTAPSCSLSSWHSFLLRVT
jgi:hypothetical protein